MSLDKKQTVSRAIFVSVIEITVPNIFCLPQIEEGKYGKLHQVSNFLLCVHISVPLPEKPATTSLRID
jgi:hypothetical protein